MRLFGNTTKKANDKDNAKIKMVEVSQLRFDRDFKNVFQQENDKVAEIANDMKANGFDKSRPIIVTEAYIIVDGHSRFMAAKKADASILENIQNGSVSIIIEPIKSLASQLYEPINLIFEPIYLIIFVYLSR